MSNLHEDTQIPAINGRRIVSAHIFNHDPDGHGVVINLDDGSELSIEFASKTQVVAEVTQSRSEEEDATVLKTFR